MGANESKSTKSSNGKSINRSQSAMDGPTSEAAKSNDSRDIIRGCFDEPHADLGNRIQMRVMEKRPDYREFLNNVGREQWQAVGDTLTQFLDAVISRIDNVDEVQRMAREFGEMHVEWKGLGFKPDFWVSIADTMTTECMYLDQAMHGQTEVLEAWSGLVGIVLSNVRDGYYERLRRERRMNRKLTSASSGGGGPGGSLDLPTSGGSVKSRSGRTTSRKDSGGEGDEVAAVLGLGQVANRRQSAM